MLLRTEALSCESVCWFPGAGVQGLQNSQVKSTIHAVAQGFKCVGVTRTESSKG